jgi:hypothetical protein
MSTHAFIGVENPDTKIIRAVYCHSNGYLAGVGKILHDYYNDLDSVNKLINMGDISDLDKVIGERHSFDLSRCPKGVSTFYHRDRGEGVIPAIRTFKSRVSFCHSAWYNLWLHVYLYDGKKWLHCRLRKRGDSNFQRMSKHLTDRIREAERRAERRRIAYISGSL